MNKIEDKYGLKAGHAIALFVILLLNITWIISSFIYYKGKLSFEIWLTIILFVAVAYYALSGYKKPHGNLMRYLLLCHTIIIAIVLIPNVSNLDSFIVADFLASIILSTYMAGRLNHYKQNIIISVLILLCICISNFYLISTFHSQGVSTTFTMFMTMTSGIYVWLAIAGAYITRFKLHKEAGFEDKKK